MCNENKGRFIVFEGIDGAGKTTQIERLAAKLRAEGRKVTVTAEDGTKLVYTVTITRDLPPAAESEATEPVTEDTIPTEATEEDTMPTEKETEPAIQEQEPVLTIGATQEPEKDIVFPIITGVSGLIIGACLTFIIMTLVYRKKK